MPNEPADEFAQNIEWPRCMLATCIALMALNLGCADNHLAALRRQCFYLALLPPLIVTRSPFPLFDELASADLRISR